MIQLQIISKILATQDMTIIQDNMLGEEYFLGYEEEYRFLLDHFSKYGNVPDKATFLSKFPEIELVTVTESNQYLVEAAREELLYNKSVPVVQNIAKLLKTDSNAAVEYMISAMKELQPNYQLGGTDIIKDAFVRFQQFVDRQENQDKWFFTSGFEELDDLIHGIQRVEEFICIVARINQGKSWVLEKICTHIWQIGFNVGYISPEMGPSSIGYRFDTLYKNLSNTGLMWSKQTINKDEYESYIKSLQEKENRFIVATPQDFNRTITITKLRNWVKQYKLDIIAIDGITYLSDERYKRGDSKTTSLTNISEDLMSLSIELEIPVIVVSQANRGGVKDEKDATPELEDIRDSDGIAANASKVISIKQPKPDDNGNVLIMEIKKSRFGKVGGKLTYQWNIDAGEFHFVPTYDDAEPRERTERKVREIKKQYSDKKDVF